MKLSEIRAILDEVDAAEEEFSAGLKGEHFPDSASKRRNKAYVEFDKLDLEALVRQWLPVVEAAKEYMTPPFDSKNRTPKLMKALEDIEE